MEITLKSKNKKYRYTSPILTPIFFAELKKHMMPSIDRIISDIPADAFDIYNWFNFRTHSVTRLIQFTDQTKQLLLRHKIPIPPPEFPKTQFSIDAHQFYKIYPSFLETIEENIRKHKMCTDLETAKYEQIFCKSSGVELLTEQYYNALTNNNKVQMMTQNMFLSPSTILKMYSMVTQIIEYQSFTVFIINSGQLLFYYFHSGGCIWTSPKYKPKTQQYSHLVLNINSGFNMLKILFADEKMYFEKLYNKIISTKQLSDDLEKILTNLCHWLEENNSTDEYDFDIDYSSDAFHNDIVLNNIDKSQLYENITKLLEMIKNKENITKIIEQLTICKTKYEKFYAKFCDQIDIKKDLQHICQRELIYDDNNYNIMFINNKHEVILSSKWAHVSISCSPNKKYFMELYGNLLKENFCQNIIHTFTETSNKIISISYELNHSHNDIVCTYDYRENNDLYTCIHRQLFCDFKDKGNFKTCNSFHLSEIAKLFGMIMLDKLEIIALNRKYYNLISSSEKINENNIIGVDIIQNDIVTIKIIVLKEDILIQSVNKIIEQIEEIIKKPFNICQFDIIKDYYDTIACTMLESNTLMYSTSDDNKNEAVIAVYFLGGIGRAIKNFFGCMSNTATTSTISYTSNTTDVNLNQNGEDLFDKKNQTVVTNKLNIGILEKKPHIVWKYAKLKNGTKCIIKLEIPEDAQYVRPIGKHIFTENFKERCSKAKVIAIQEYRFDIEIDLPYMIAYSPIDKSKFKYIVGSIVEPDQWDPNPDVVCTHGIHVFSHRQSIINLVNLYSPSPTAPVELPEIIAQYKKTTNEFDDKLSVPQQSTVHSKKITKQSIKDLNDKLSVPQQSMPKGKTVSIVISDSDDD